MTRRTELRLLALHVACGLSFLFAACEPNEEPLYREYEETGDANIPWTIPNAGVDSAAPVPRNDAGVGDGGRDAGLLGRPDAAPEDAMPPDETLDIFDPDEVYAIFGRATGSGLLIAPIDAPERAIAGLASVPTASTPEIRPADGRLLYRSPVISTGHVAAFRCDGCVFADAQSVSPRNPEANDEPLALSPCSEASLPVLGLHLGPEGGMVHACGASWYNAEGQVLAQASDAAGILRLGYRATALSRAGVLDLGSGALAPLVGLPQGARIIATRAQTDGYWVVAHSAEADELWLVAFDGTATRVAVYPPPQAPITNGGAAALDARGSLAQSALVFPNVAITRRSIDGTSEIVFGGEDDPATAMLRPSSVALFTGP